MVGVMELIRIAKERVENLSPSDLANEMAAGKVVVVDIREPSETADGVIAGAVLAPRGLLEFHADPSTKYHLPALRPENRIVL